MKELLVIPQYYYPTQGGLQNFTHRLCTALAKKNVAITILYSNNSQNDLTFLDDYPHNERIKLLRVSDEREDLWPAATRFIKSLDAPKKVLVIGLDYAEFIERQLELTKTITDCGHDLYLRIATTDDFNEHISRDSKRVDKLSRCKAIITLNDAIEEEIHNCFGNALRTEHIPNIIGTTNYRKLDHQERSSAREYLGLPDNGALLLWTGRLDKRKQLEDLLLCWHQADVAGNLAITGIEFFDNDPYFKKIAAIINDVGIQNVHFKGPFLEKDMPAVYGCSDAFAFTSNREGFCNSILEAAACKLPIVAYDVPGVRVVLENYDPRLYHLIELNNKHAFSDTLGDVCKKVSNGHYTALPDKPAFLNDHYSPCSVAEKYIKLVFKNGSR